MATAGTGKRRGSLSRSPLASPNTLIHSLAGRVQEYIHLPVPDSLYIVLGAIAANMMKGDPVWLMLVGPSSSGKGTLIRSLMELPRVHDVGNLTGEASLLSGVSKKDVEKGATGGILRKVGLRGCLVMEDFTSTMNGMSFDQRNAVLDAFRKMYNGWWTRDVGSDGGKTLTWGPDGKLALIAGATLEIDRMHSANAALGERWLYYRFADSDGYRESVMSGNSADPETNRADLRGWIVGFFQGMGLDWGCSMGCKMAHEHQVEADRRELTTREMDRVFAMASFVAKVRSDVPRDPRSHEVNGLAKPEAPPRLNTMLCQLYRGMEAIGLNADERWRCLMKVALDSAPQLRVRLILELASSLQPVKLQDLKVKLKCSIGTIRRAVEDLSIHGLVEYEGVKGRVAAKDDDGSHGAARLSGSAKQSLETGWGKDIIPTYMP